MNELAPYEYMPDELLVDEYHPNNTQYIEQVAFTRRAMVAAAADMRPRAVEIVKLSVRGRRSKDIAEELDITQGAVSAALNQPKAKKLLNLSRHLLGLQEGPSLEHRKRSLWEMVVDNQKNDPKIAIAAISEMNKMDGVGRDTPDTNIHITVDNGTPRGALDG